MEFIILLEFIHWTNKLICQNGIRCMSEECQDTIRWLLIVQIVLIWYWSQSTTGVITLDSFYEESIFWSLYMVESEHEDSLNSSSKVNTLPRLFASWWNISKSNKCATSNSYSWADNFFQIVELKFFWSLPYRSLEFLKIKGRAAMLSGGECCWTILRTIFYTRDIFEKKAD